MDKLFSIIKLENIKVHIKYTFTQNHFRFPFLEYKLIIIIIKITINKIILDKMDFFLFPLHDIKLFSYHVFIKFLPLDEAIAYRAVFVIVSGKDGQTETLLEPAQ